MWTQERNEDGQHKKVTVTRGPIGWDVTEEHDDHVVKHQTFTDWHRVERALQVFTLRPHTSTNR